MFLFKIIKLSAMVYYSICLYIVEQATGSATTDPMLFLTRLAWVIMPVILTIFGNQYFQRRKEEKEDQKKIFKSIGDKIEKLEETLSGQVARYEGMMAKMQYTADTLAKVMNDVKDHDKIIAGITMQLKGKN